MDLDGSGAERRGDAAALDQSHSSQDGSALPAVRAAVFGDLDREGGGADHSRLRPLPLGRDSGLRSDCSGDHRHSGHLGARGIRFHGAGAHSDCH